MNNATFIFELKLHPWLPCMNPSFPTGKCIFITETPQFMMISALYYTNTVSWVFILLAHWNNVSIHLATLSWIRANQSLLVPCFSWVVAKTNVIVFGFTRAGHDHTITRSTALEEIMLTFKGMELCFSRDGKYFFHGTKMICWKLQGQLIYSCIFRVNLIWFCFKENNHRNSPP